MNERAGQRGTTLIELSVVIAVLLVARGSAVYRHNRLENRLKYSGLHHQSCQYSKGSPRISKHERAGDRRFTPGNHFNRRRILDDSADLSDRSCLRILIDRPRFRSGLRNLPCCRSRAVDDPVAQLVTIAKAVA